MYSTSPGNWFEIMYQVRFDYLRSMVYKGRRQIATIAVLIKSAGLCEVPKSHRPLLSVPDKGVSYKTYRV